jgi:hypothetical protein
MITTSIATQMQWGHVAQIVFQEHLHFAEAFVGASHFWA